MAIIIDIIFNIISSIKSGTNNIIIFILSWILSIISIFPFPYLSVKEEEKSILLKLFLYTFPFYTLLTCSYEGIFLILYYNYLQLWIRMQWRKKNETYNLIDTLFLIFITYYSFYGIVDVLTIMDFKFSSTRRFVPDKDFHIFETLLIMCRTFIPGFFVSAAFLEKSKKYNYSNIDSIILSITLSQIMNIKFFFSIKDHGSWQDIGLGISFLVISGIVPLVPILSFSIIKCIFWKDLNTDIKDFIILFNFRKPTKIFLIILLVIIYIFL